MKRGEGEYVTEHQEEEGKEVQFTIQLYYFGRIVNMTGGLFNK